MLTNITNKVTVVATIIVISCLNASAQNTIRAFNSIYSENLKGGTTMFGNTILNVVSSSDQSNNSSVNLTYMNQTSNPNNGVGGLGYSQYGNDGNNMQFTDIDNMSSTQNSSSADLILPSGTNTIKFARLYWGGKINNSVITASPDTLRKIKIRKGTSGAYFNALTPTTNVDQFAISSTEKAYQSFVDITSFINTNGGGTYTVADLPITSGTSSTGGKYGGWVIVVAYENLSQPYNSIRLYDGFSQVYSNGNTTYLTIQLNGLNVPSTPLLSNEAVMGTMAWEGDANLGASQSNPDGDFIKINNVTVQNAVNPAKNFWNGSISKNGAFVTTKNPNYSNQMGIDIDEVNVGTGYNIQPNATSLTFQFGTEADMYFPSIFTFSIRVKDPTVTLNKTVADANNNGFVESNEELTYTLSGNNQGTGSSYNTYIVDSLPRNVSYVPNTLQVINAAGVTSGIKTDAQDNDQAFKGTTSNNREYVKFFIGNGATGSVGGELPTGTAGNYAVKFKVRAQQIPGSIINTARIYGNSVVGDLFTDDGTAVIGEDSAVMPVKFTSFTASLLNSKNSLLKWTTLSEINNDYFEVERSDDGIHFSTRGKVYGNGSTTISHDYTFNDALNSSSAIVYYRLRIFDTDGKYTFSKIIAIRIGAAMSIDKFNVFPNPFITDIKVSLNSEVEVSSTFRILSFDGRELIRRTIDVQKGDNIIVLKDFGTLPKGNYILEVSTATDKFIKKIVKN
jgi:uncharacterized repeat protein (TIGR01451 family)